MDGLWEATVLSLSFKNTLIGVRFQTTPADPFGQKAHQSDEVSWYFRKYDMSAESNVSPIIISKVFKEFNWDLTPINCVGIQVALIYAYGLPHSFELPARKARGLLPSAFLVCPIKRTCHDHGY